MDGRDESIITYLQGHGDASTREISDATDIPASTVHKRKKELEDADIIQQYTVDVDWEKIGYSFTGYVLLTVDLPQLRRQGLQQTDLLEELEAIEEVTDARIITGEYDMLVTIRASDKTEFNTVLQRAVQSLTGVQDTTTMIALD